VNNGEGGLVRDVKLLQDVEWKTGCDIGDWDVGVKCSVYRDDPSSKPNNRVDLVSDLENGCEILV
jgi:hypothetical protein